MRSLQGSPARRYFLFLEIQDRDFNAFYSDTLYVLTGSRPTKPPHLTVRGPYKHPISPTELQRWRDVMQFSVLKVGPVGRFSNPGQEVIYLEVDSHRLREIWWKPDYPISQVGYNPHISLYRGSDSELAERLMSFRPLREVEFLCAEYQVVPVLQDRHASESLNLNPLQRAADHQRFMEAGRVPTDFFRRLSDVASASVPRSPSQLTLDF